MQQEMTMEEIEAQFDGQWVLIADPETDQYNRVVKGTVVFHSHDLHETDAYFLAQRDSPIYSWASFYVGDMPKGVKVLL